MFHQRHHTDLVQLVDLHLQLNLLLEYLLVVLEEYDADDLLEAGGGVVDQHVLGGFLGSEQVVLLR